MKPFLPSPFEYPQFYCRKGCFGLRTAYISACSPESLQASPFCTERTSRDQELPQLSAYHSGFFKRMMIPKCSEPTTILVSDLANWEYHLFMPVFVSPQNMPFDRINNGFCYASWNSLSVAATCIQPNQLNIFCVWHCKLILTRIGTLMFGSCSLYGFLCFWGVFWGFFWPIYFSIHLFSSLGHAFSLCSFFIIKWIFLLQRLWSSYYAQRRLCRIDW